MMCSFNVAVLILCHLKMATSFDMCEDPKKIGPCKARIPRYFFNTATGRCELFYWGGCEPNKNNFKTEKECISTCVGQPADVCDQPKKIGPCKASFPRYFFDKAAGECKMFYWGGCQANGNNFKTKEECQKKCKPGTSAGLYYQKYSNNSD